MSAIEENVKLLKQNQTEIYNQQKSRRQSLLDDPKNRETLKKIRIGHQVAKTLHDARVAAKLTQAELAKKLHTSQSFISSAERGQGNLTIETVERFVEACGKHLELHLV